MTPRVGDVVRHYGHDVIARVVSIEYDNRPLYNLSVNGYDGILEGELEVLTVSELFEAAGHPVPQDAEIYYDHQYQSGAESFGDWWAWSTLCAYSVWWPNADEWEEPNETEPKPWASSRAWANLSRLPAGDAWDALPDVVKAVVK